MSTTNDHLRTIALHTPFMSEQYKFGIVLIVFITFINKYNVLSILLFES